jgi:hypothetical protein
MAKFDPAATAVQVMLGTIWVGEVTLVVVPVPSWPLLLLPHVQRVPSDAIATAKFDPAATAVQVMLLPIWMGEG